MQRIQRYWTGLPRAGARELLRSRGVQALLVGVAVTQVVVVAERKGGEVAPVALAPVVVTQPAQPATTPASAAWTTAALERESERIAAEYRQQGFKIPTSLEAQIQQAAAEFEIAPDVAFGLIRAESAFRNGATSPVGAVGLTQLMPGTARWMEPGVTRSQLRDPQTNLRIGFKYLRYLLDKYEGDEDLALLAYNRGPGTVDRALKRGQNPDNGYAKFVRGEKNHGHKLFTR